MSILGIKKQEILFPLSFLCYHVGLKSAFRFCLYFFSYSL